MDKTKILNSKIRKHPVIKDAIKLDMDLVLVSSHNSACSCCNKFEGKVFSITGEYPEFPILCDVPPFCDNCRHTIYNQAYSAMKVEGTLEDFIAFSNGKTDIHPYSKGFIPVNQRPKIDIEIEIKMRKELLKIIKKQETRIKIMDNTPENTKKYKTANEEYNNLEIEKNEYINKLKESGSWGDLIEGLKDRYIELFEIL